MELKFGDQERDFGSCDAVVVVDVLGLNVAGVKLSDFFHDDRTNANGDSFVIVISR
ncbi:hypothetical protein D3C87_1948990 [compost metagenome]